MGGVYYSRRRGRYCAVLRLELSLHYSFSCPGDSHAGKRGLFVHRLSVTHRVASQPTHRGARVRLDGPLPRKPGSGQRSLRGFSLLFLRAPGDTDVVAIPLLIPVNHIVAAVDAVYGTNFDMVYGVSSAVGYDFPLRRAAGLLTRSRTVRMA